MLFWDRSLAEMRALDPQVELVPAKFQTPFAECFHMYFTGLGGARVHAKLLRPKDQSRAPARPCSIFHGYSGDSGDWVNKLPYVAAGFTVAALDCRGQAGLSQDVSQVPAGSPCAATSSAASKTGPTSCISGTCSWIPPRWPGS